MALGGTWNMLGGYERSRNERNKSELKSIIFTETFCLILLFLSILRKHILT